MQRQKREWRMKKTCNKVLYYPYFLLTACLEATEKLKVKQKGNNPHLPTPNYKRAMR